MSEKSNIDDLFGNLKDFKSDSPSSGWTHVSEKVFFNNMTANLQRLTVKTGDYLWGNIAKRLLWQNFMHFSYSTFNVFYLGAILLLLSLMLFTFLPEKNLQTHQESGNLMVMNADADNLPSFDNTNTVKDAINSNNLSNSVKQQSSKNVLPAKTKSVAITKDKKSPLIVKNNQITNTVQSRDIVQSGAKRFKLNLAQTQLIQPKFKNVPPIDKNILVVDTFQVFDTIHFYDTLAVIQKNDIKLNNVEKGYSVNFYFA